MTDVGELSVQVREQNHSLLHRDPGTYCLKHKARHLQMCPYIIFLRMPSRHIYSQLAKLDTLDLTLDITKCKVRRKTLKTQISQVTFPNNFFQ